MNTLIPGAPLRSLSPTSIEYQRAQGASRAAKPARAARFTLDAPEHSGTIPGAIGDILPPGVALTSNLAVIFTLNQYTMAIIKATLTDLLNEHARSQAEMLRAQQDQSRVSAHTRTSLYLSRATIYLTNHLLRSSLSR